MQTKQTSSSEEEQYKKLKNLSFYRNTELFLDWVKTLKEQKANFKVVHSKYMTGIELSDGSKINFILNKYRNKVFIAHKMVLKDLSENPRYNRIKETEHSTKNFSVRNGLENCQYKEVINLDISSAYASTMFAQGLIKENTFKMLQSLEKHERLPAMGMLAKRSLVYNYKQGICEDTKLRLGDNRQIFFFLIQKVEECMNECRALAGDYYLFHWVDGIFIKNDLPVETLKKIEKVLERYGYKYKYEKVINLDVQRNKGILSINMNKNGQDKEYTFNDPNYQENFETVVRCLEDLEVSQSEDTIRQNVSTPPVLEFARGHEEIDITPWLEQS